MSLYRLILDTHYNLKHNGMKTLTIDGRLKVKTLKDNFKEAFGGTLRVYNGNKKADDDATLASIRTNDTASGEVECTENMTVGEFETELAEKFGIKVQVASPDDWVLALDEYTLSTVCDIPKNATKAKMQELLDEQYAADEAEIGDVAPADNASEYVPAKKSAISGEYIITVKANNSVEVFRIYDNVRGSLREAAEAAGFKYDPDWNTRRFGLMLVKAYGQGTNQATIGEYTVTLRPSGAIETYRIYSNTKGALREIAGEIGFNYDESWNTQQFGSKLVDYINENK